jgi:hypothetical protein
VKRIKNNEVLFIDKINCAAKLGVRSIASSAIDRTPACVHSSAVRSVAGASLCSVRSIVSVAFDRTMCDRSQITALMEHRAG